MIRSKEDALVFIKKNGVKLSNHKSVIVTENNSIYLDSEVPGDDLSERFYLKGKESEKEILPDAKELGESKLKDKKSKK